MQCSKMEDLCSLVIYEGIEFVVWSLTAAMLCAWKMTNFIIFKKKQGREGHDPTILNFI